VADNNLIHDISYGGTYCCAIFPAPGSARQTITRNTIYRTGRSGIDGVYSNKEIAYNDIYGFGLINTDLGAIYSARNTDLTGTHIHHNWLHDAGNDKGHAFPVGAGIYFDQNAKPAQIDHNVFWNNHMNDVRLEQAKPPFHRVFNNTLASTDAKYWFAFHSYPGGSPENLNNNIYRARIDPNKPGTHELTVGTDPKFTNVGAGGLKFRLQTDSPAIDRGVVIPSVTDGHKGTAPDLGAYEYGGTDWVAGCTLPLILDDSRPVASTSNLLLNPSFEDGRRDWSFLEPGEVVAGSAHALAGSTCLKITVDGKSKYRVYQAPQGIKPGETLYFRCWMKSDSLNGEATVILKFWIDRAKDQFKYFTPGWAKGSTDWREYSISVVAPENFKGDLQIVCFAQNCSYGEAYFDDLRFVRGEGQ
jgi:hypothetical protein